MPMPMPVSIPMWKLRWGRGMRTLTLAWTMPSSPCLPGAPWHPVLAGGRGGSQTHRQSWSMHGMLCFSMRLAAVS
ncbi:hypothetical protein VFPFJ_04148 [Purpureocillium lilacinum]|uniref:Uncharacterized protein n=1 Tax=Purpureocillium lilacinum TaxID=33203 RepID=A0A179HS50_PURLI|nr:hypothetical protein VFPFJ_04148 [Purpureocillium lilacinum]OAQ82370.1 hypothetical protein VFPBJ_04954 [Purpureocillium lilacinum]OAQ92408.1 hypothetical protein VFPFJ_04148 [Purpureocillium lilacinum]